MRYHRNRAFVCVLACLAMFSMHGWSADIYVSLDGKDTWSGTQAAPNADLTDGPFRTLQRARDEVRKRNATKATPPRGCVVEIAGGTYEFAETLTFGQEDSGAADAEITYQASKGQQVRLCGGRIVNGFHAVTDDAVRSRLDPSAANNVVQADLKALGIKDFGEMGGGFGQGGGPGLELFFSEKPMTLARWPNDGFIKITDVLGATPVDVRGTKGCKEANFVYEGDRPRRWVGEKNAWVLGYWFWDWAEQRQRVASIDPEKHSMTLAEPYHGYGYRKGQWFYGFNILAELDSPGEWYLDRESGILYFWPPSPIDGGQAVVSELATLVSMKNVSHVTLRGLVFEAARGTALIMENGEGNQVADCLFRNLGSSAVSISGGSHHTVVNCEITGTGDGGISMNGGDRAQLTPSGHVARNNHIHHWSRWNRMYRPAIMMNGVGQVASHNLIEYSPHMAIGFGGNDHVIEFNEIHNVCTESNDAGAIYAGRDWTQRGTAVRFNYLHDITGFEQRGCVGVYLDDMYCGTKITGNLFRNVTMAAFIGGGRDNVVDNNIFVDCRPALHIDARALGWAHDHADGWIAEGKEKRTLSGILFRDPPYSVRYPELPAILDNDPAAPRGNVVSRNICVGGKWDNVEAKARPMVEFRANFLEGDPGFVDAKAGNYQLRDDSPALKLGFQRIPLDQIGRK